MSFKTNKSPVRKGEGEWLNVSIVVKQRVQADLAVKALLRDMLSTFPGSAFTAVKQRVLVDPAQKAHQKDML